MENIQNKSFEEWQYIKENHAEEWFKTFMKTRGNDNTTKFADYVMYLEDIKHDYEVLKEKIANLSSWAEERH